MELDQTEETDIKRSLEPTRAPKATKAKKTAKVERKHIDPERLYRAVRYLKEHPKR